MNDHSPKIKTALFGSPYQSPLCYAPLTQLNRMKRIMVRAFSSHSLTLTVDATKFLVTDLEHRIPALKSGSGDIKSATEEAQEFLNQLLVSADKSKLNNNLVSVETLEAWIKSLEKARAAHQSLSGLADDDDSLMSGDMTSMVFDEEEIFQVCDAFDTETTKRWKFQPTRRTFELDNASNSRTGEAKNRSDMLRQRYWIVHQRMQRLSSGTFGQKETGLTAIESLVGSNGVKRILGTISQIEEGKWFLEDPKSAIELDFSEMVPADIESGFFTEGSICVAEGEVLNDRDAFAVHSLKFGPAEPLELTRRAFPSTDFFGANLDHRLEERLLKFEESTANDGNDSFLLVSDVWLDDPKVWERLRFVVSGAASAPPFAIVFMGNFVSPSHATSISTYTEGFEKLADLLGAAPELLRRTRLVFVPGPTDLTPSRDVLPSPALVKPVREAFEKRLKRAVASAKGGSAPGDLHAWPSVHFTSNPTRIRYCTKQLVFFREDVTNKLRRHCFLRPSTTETGSLSDHLVRTLCDQSHLCPLPVTVKPIYWNYDHAMRLYPLPDFITVSDQSTRFVVEYEGTRALSPGSFAIDGTFASISPLTGQVSEFKA